MSPRLGLTGKLAAVLGLFAAVLLATMGGLAYRSGRDGLAAATVADLLSTALEKEAALSGWIEDRQLELRILGAPVSLADGVAVLAAAAPGSAAWQAARDRVVAELLPRIGAGGFLELIVIEPSEGRVVAATDPGQEGKFREDRPYFVNGRKGPYVQPPYHSLERGGPAMTVSLPLRGTGRELRGVLVGFLDLAEMHAMVSRRTGLQRTDEAYLVNRSSLFITQPRLVADPAVLQRGVHAVAVRRCLAGESGIMRATDHRGIPALIVHRWLAQREMCLVVKIDQREAFEPVAAFGRTVLLTGGMGLVVASALAVGLASSITRPIRVLQSGVARFGAGEMSVRLPETRRDELGRLAGEFNRMAASLAGKDAALRSHADRLAAANKELEAFSYSVSHDLRAPLRAVDGFARILVDKHGPKLAPEAQRYLGLVRDNARHMGQLVDDLLEFSRLGRHALSTRPVSPADLVRQALEDLRAEQEGRRVEIRVGDLPPCEADPALLQQVWLNLLDNALKFTRGREVARVEVGCRADGDTPVYFVRDNGAGFDMQYAGNLFGVFQRLHRAEEFPGTGVGLAIVQRIVRRHGGRVWAEAAPDAGATFFFTLDPGGPRDAGGGGAR